MAHPLSPPISPRILSPAQEIEALRLARAAVESWVLRRETTFMEPSQSGMGGTRAAAFVSLYQKGQLRGCVGTLEPGGDLGPVLIECAVAAASRDPRFSPLSPAELQNIRLEVSVLTAPVEVAHPEEIVVGRDGVVMEKDGRKGLLLPQVAPQHGWTREVFLDQVCLKAGLLPGAWKEGARIMIFQAQVFAEPER
ncbi:MAG TPA: AmmeMemoRadiSam system protein A [Candidatus Polarisedimenticolia bacterium]|nr:AmmeMemoRadiSam system protein A [Candidatus Polarisedimenticolia bacterium]